MQHEGEVFVRYKSVFERKTLVFLATLQGVILLNPIDLTHALDHILCVRLMPQICDSLVHGFLDSYPIHFDPNFPHRSPEMVAIICL